MQLGRPGPGAALRMEARMIIETKLRPDEPRTVFGYRTASDFPVARRFETAEAMERWLRSNHVTVYAIESQEKST